MRIYLVGGAVRDQLLHQPITDKDWVVVGATPEDLQQLGYRAVGKDFPVFLHPLTHEEYALARTEKKSGKGHKGFTFFTSTEVTLEQDLQRRDLTINAIAQDDQGNYIDPFGGQRDIQQKILRHVSTAFGEDPLRILRVARFAARYAELGFRIAPETKVLMQNMVKNRALEELSAERVWSETYKALCQSQPHVYFQVLYECHALSDLFPELDTLFSIPYASPENTLTLGSLALNSLQIATTLTYEADIRFAVLCHQIGGETYTTLSAQTEQHTMRTLGALKKLCNRLKVPNTFRDLAALVLQHQYSIQRIRQASAEAILGLLNEIDVWRKPYRLKQLAMASEACLRGIPEKKHTLYGQGQYLFNAYHAIQGIRADEITKAGFTGYYIRLQLYQRRLAALHLWKENNP